MWWKKVLIGFILLVVALYAAIYAFLHLYGLDRFKPRITSAVQDATGRRLSIAGELEVDFGLLPVLAAEDIAFENASWGSRNDMIRIKRFQVRVALLPLILGRLEIGSIVLIGADVLLEKNPAGEFNIPSGSGGNGNGTTRAGFPVIHRLKIEDARLVYDDMQAGRQLTLALDRLRAELPDTDSPLEVDLEGKFNRVPVEIFGTVGRPLPAFTSGGQLPAALTVEIADNRFEIAGVVANTADLSGLDLKITGAGQSIPDLGRLAGIDNLPDPGPFKIQVRFSGSPKQLTMSDLSLHAGDSRLAKVFLRGRIGHLLRLEDLDLQVTAAGDDLQSASERLGQPMPWQGAYRAAGRLLRSAGKKWRLDAAEFTVGDNDVAGTLALDLQPEKPLLKATVRSRRFDLRPIFAPGAFQRPTADGKTGKRSSPAAGRKDRKQQEPLLKRFDADVTLATGPIYLPKMVINELHTEARLENGRISIQTKGPRPPDLEELAGIPALPELGPIQLACDLVGTAGGLSLRNVDLKAGSLQQARVTVSGSIAELTKPKGFGLDIGIEGDDAASLGKYLLQPWPLRGKYTVSARMNDPARAVFAFDSISGSLDGIDFTGSVKVDAAGKDTRVAVAVNTPRLHLNPFVLPGLQTAENVGKAVSSKFGPLDASLVLAVSAGKIGIADLQLAAGSDEQLAISLQGAVGDVKTLTGLDIQVEAGGRDAAELGRLFGKPIPLKGPYTLRTAITDPAAGTYRFDPLFLSLAGDQATGYAQLDRSGKPILVTADLATSEIDLTALVPVAAERVKPDAGKVEEVLDRRLVLPQWPVPPALIYDLDTDIRIRAGRVKAANLDVRGLLIKIESPGDEVKLNAEARTVFYGKGSEEAFDNFQMGGVKLSLRGQAAGNRMAIRSFTFRGGSPDTVSLSLEGSADDFIAQTGINLTFDIHGQEAGYLWQLLDADYRSTGPFSLTGSLADPRPKQYRLEDLKAALGESSIDGRLEIDYTGKRPRFSARITAPYLDLRPYLPEAPDPGTAAATPATGSARKRKVFSDRPWRLGILEKIDLAVSLDAAQLYAPRAAVKDLRFDLKLDEGNLVLRPLAFTSGGGTITGELTLRTSVELPTLSGSVEISDYDVGRELEELGRRQDIQGPLNGRIELSGPAESTAAFMGELNGQVVFSVTEGKINNRIIGTVYGDIGDNLRNLIAPVRGKDPFIELNCLVQSFDIRSGRARHLGLLDTTQTALVSNGTVDLSRETLDITLRSAPKGGVRFGGLGRIGFSLNNLTRPFKLSGTLARPTLAVDPSQTALTIGKIFGGIALGPAGIAAILADVSVGNKNPCLVAMEAMEKNAGTIDKDDLIKSEDLIDQTTDALIEGSEKIIEESEKTINRIPKR